MIRINIDEESCLGDGICVDFCPYGVLEMKGKDGRPVATVVRLESCTACYTCVGQCPSRAIQVLHQ